MVVKFRSLRWFALLGMLLTGASVFLLNPFVTYAVAVLWLGAMAFFVRCPTCDKSPYVLKRGPFNIGSPVPEQKCSNCGRDLLLR